MMKILILAMLLMIGVASATADHLSMDDPGSAKITIMKDGNACVLVIWQIPNSTQWAVTYGTLTSDPEYYISNETGAVIIR